MKIIIDTESQNMCIDSNNVKKEIALYSKEAFEILSQQWKLVGWNQKYMYTFSWMGRPIIQLPEDMVRLQELIYNIKPDVIVETGIAHGGSLIYYASIFKAIGKGRVIGIDIDIREHNKKALEEHELFPLITLVEGSSTDKNVFEKVKSYISNNEKVIVLLDSCHSASHVYDEIKLYSELIPKDSYIVVQDGIMEELWDIPRGENDWKYDNPVTAVNKFLNENENFAYEEPKWMFNESDLENSISHWNKAWIKRIK